jgi:hypothetical protein
MNAMNDLPPRDARESRSDDCAISTPGDAGPVGTRRGGFGSPSPPSRGADVLLGPGGRDTGDPDAHAAAVVAGRCPMLHGLGIFGPEVTRSGFHKIVEDAVAAASSHADIRRFDGRIGGETQALARAPIAARDNRCGNSPNPSAPPQPRARRSRSDTRPHPCPPGRVRWTRLGGS